MKKVIQFSFKPFQNWWKYLNKEIIIFSILDFGYILTSISQKSPIFSKMVIFRFKCHKMTKKGQNQKNWKVWILYFGLKRIFTKLEEVWMKTEWLFFILAWKLLKFDPYGFSYVFEKTPWPISFYWTVLSDLRLLRANFARFYNGHFSYISLFSSRFVA